MGKRGSELCKFLWNALICGTYGNYLTWVEEQKKIFRLYLVHRNSKEWTKDSCKILVDWHEKSFRKDNKNRTQRKTSISDPRQLLLSAMTKSKFLKFFPEKSNGNIRIFQFREKIDIDNSFQLSSPSGQLPQFSPDGDSGFQSPQSSTSPCSPKADFPDNETIFHGEINNNDLLSSLPEPTPDLDMYLQQPECMDFLNYDMDSISRELLNNDLKSTENIDQVMEMPQKVKNVEYENSVEVTAHKWEMDPRSTKPPAVGSPTFQEGNFSVQKSEAIEQSKMAANSFVTTLREKSEAIEQSKMAANSFVITLREKSEAIEQSKMAANSFVITLRDGTFTIQISGPGMFPAKH